MHFIDEEMGTRSVGGQAGFSGYTLIAKLDCLPGRISCPPKAEIAVHEKVDPKFSGCCLLVPSVLMFSLMFVNSCGPLHSARCPWDTSFLLCTRTARMSRGLLSRGLPGSLSVAVCNTVPYVSLLWVIYLVLLHSLVKGAWASESS